MTAAYRTKTCAVQNVPNRQFNLISDVCRGFPGQRISLRPGRVRYGVMWDHEITANIYFLPRAAQPLRSWSLLIMEFA